jgi:tRNA(Ile)-lysidine synthase
MRAFFISDCGFLMMDFCGLAAVFLETAVSPVNLLASSEKFVVGVSGGPDSLALLHVLARVVGPTRLVAAHLNHGYRETAVAEADFVREISGSWGIAFEVSTVDLPLVAQQSGDSLEEAGRKARYAFLHEVAAAHGTHYLAVGHHADDQAETVLMNLLRGSGLRGLRGMLPVTPLAEAPDYYVLRPFLTVNRADIETYCQEHALTPVFDESNEDISFFRNRIRQELLPLLEDYNAGVRTHLRQLAAMAAADVALLDSLTADAWAQVAAKVDQGVLCLTALLAGTASWAAAL